MRWRFTYERLNKHEPAVYAAELYVQDGDGLTPHVWEKVSGDEETMTFRGSQLDRFLRLLRDGTPDDFDPTAEELEIVEIT